MAASVVLALILWPVRSSLVAGIAMILVVALAIGLAARPWRTRPPFATLDGRYQQACDESRYWLEKWSELFALAAQGEHLGEAERLLLHEALAGAADAAADVSARRNDYASRFIANGFDRLDHLIATQPSRPSPATTADIQQALDTIEQYLDTLWIEEHVAKQAKTELAQAQRAQPAHQRAQLLELAGSVRLFDSRPGQVGVDLEAERFRLRAERMLLRESPLTEADFFDDIL